MEIRNNMNNIINEIRKCGERIDGKDSKKLMNVILKSRKIFVTGAGRSGLAGKAFAMRLMHLGILVYVVGETTTPSIEKNDLLIAISGSGETKGILEIVKAARSRKAKVALITYNRNSEIGKLSDVVIELEGTFPKNKYADHVIRQVMGEDRKIAPLGTIFELTSMIFLDAIIIELMKINNKSEQEMKKRHANLE
ncbi:MAG: 6-phospho-3-hexuloisomerase [Candidatus ainarchaeum sp.]|nr:6-phospho-3-hexuloisomerase [Candidatus ainarchaeum sp.]